MAKELPYFRFTVSEWLNGDINLESYELQGLFINVCAYYWFKDCSLTRIMLDKKFSNAKTLLEELFLLGIIKEFASGLLEIKFLNEQYNLLSDNNKKRSKAGRIGGLRKSSNARNLLKQKSSYKDKDKDKDKDIVQEEQSNAAAFIGKHTQKQTYDSYKPFSLWIDITGNVPTVFVKGQLNKLVLEYGESKLVESMDKWASLGWKSLDSLKDLISGKAKANRGSESIDDIFAEADRKRAVEA